MTSPVVLLRVDREAARRSPHPRHLHPPIELKVLQAAITNILGRPVPFIDGWRSPFSVDEVLAAIKDLAPRCVVIKGATWCLDEALSLGQKLRAIGVTTVAVGELALHHSLKPIERWGQSFDLSVAGDPEELLPSIIPSLLDTPERARRLVIPTQQFGTIEDPGAVPIPEYTDEELLAYPFPLPLTMRPVESERWGYVLTAWGCPRPCRHCSVVVRKSTGRDLRVKPVGRVMDEVRRLVDQGATTIAFEDDSLFVARKRFIELADAIVRSGLKIRWIANARPDELDEERVVAARTSGAVLVKIGIETLSEKLLSLIEKTPDVASWRGNSERAVALLRQHGIRSVGLFLVGLPGETEIDVGASKDFVQRNPIDYLQVQIWQPYPDVGIFSDRVAAFHYSTAASDDSLYARRQKDLYRSFYFRPSYVVRHFVLNWRHYLRNPGILTKHTDQLSFLIPKWRPERG